MDGDDIGCDLVVDLAEASVSGSWKSFRRSFVSQVAEHVPAAHAARI